MEKDKIHAFPEPTKDGEFLKVIFEDVIKKILNYQSLTQKQYKDLIYDYTYYVASMLNLDSINLRIDSSLEGSDTLAQADYGYFAEEDNLINLAPDLIKKPKDFSVAIDNLMTIAHEACHIFDYYNNYNPYFKFDNENGDKFTENRGVYIEKLVEQCNFDKNFSKDLAFALYFTCPYEIRARNGEHAFIKDLFNKSLEYFNSHPEIQNKLTKMNLGMMRYAILDNGEYLANKLEESKQKFEDPRMEDFKKQLNLYIENFTKQKYYNEENETEDSVNFNSLFFKIKFPLIKILDIPEVSTQENIDKVFEYWLKSPLQNLDGIITLMGMKNNKKTRVQLEKLFEEVYKQTGLVGLTNILNEVRTLKFPDNTIPFKYFQMEFTRTLAKREKLTNKIKINLPRKESNFYQDDELAKN